MKYQKITKLPKNWQVSVLFAILSTQCERTLTVVHPFVIAKYMPGNGNFLLQTTL